MPPRYRREMLTQNPRRHKGNCAARQPAPNLFSATPKPASGAGLPQFGGNC